MLGSEAKVKLAISPFICFFMSTINLFLVLYVLKENLELAKRGFKVASSKLGCPTSVKITELKKKLTEDN